MTAALATATDSRFDELFGAGRSTNAARDLVADADAALLPVLTSRSSAAGERLTIIFSKLSKGHYGASVICVDGQPWGFVSYFGDAPKALYLAEDPGLDTEDPATAQLLAAIKTVLSVLATGVAAAPYLQALLANPADNEER